MKPSSRALLLATVAMTAASLGSVVGASPATSPARRRPQVQRMPPSSNEEVAAWNAAVEAKRLAKKRGRK